MCSASPDALASIFEGSVTRDEHGEAERALARLRGLTDSADDGLPPEVRADLRCVLDYVAKVEQDASDLQLLYSMTVEASTALENELSRRNDVVTGFVAQTSHELRTPLNAIMGLSELVMEELADTGEHRYDRDLRRIRDAGKHLLVLIDEILDLSKVEAGRLELCPEVFQLEPMLRDVVTGAQPLARGNGNQLRIEISNRLGAILGDPLRIRQCLLNLLGNACKFTRNGEITLRAGRRSDATGDWILLAVQDTGIGMTTEQLARVFHPYAQADARTSREYGGTGLGLAFTLSLCRHMGGDIEVATEHGSGSTFTLRLPARLA